MTHPTPGELLELHFGELPLPLRAAVEGHAASCAACRALLTDVDRIERTLGAGPGDVPPADGLLRVLARIEAVRPARARRLYWLRAALPSAAALCCGTLAAHQGGTLAVLVFFALGSIVTLALAPVLILESQRGSS
jgi:hypothetical protein